MKVKNLFPIFCGLVLAACGEAEFIGPLPATGTVIFATDPPNIAGTQCRGLTLNGQPKFGPAQTKIRVPADTGDYFSKCIADGYEEGESSPSHLEGGEVETSTVHMVKRVEEPPPITTAVVWITSNVPGAKLDSTVRYSPALVRSSSQIGANTPHRTTVTADGSLYMFWVSAQGYENKPVSWAPTPGTTETLQANLKLIPPPPPTPPTTGELLIASSPTGMSAKIIRVATNGTETIVTTVITDTVLVLGAGHYRIECRDLSSNHLPADAFAVVNAGLKSEPAVCILAKKPEPPAPPPPPPPTTGKLLVASVPPGMQAVLKKHGSSAVVASGTTNFERVVEQGFYTAECVDPSGKYAPTSAVGAVNAGQNSVLVCVMLEILVPPPPPLPPAPPQPVLKPDTVQLTFPDPTISEANPLEWLWGQEVKFAGPHVGPVQIQVLVKYTTSAKEEFALRMRRPDGTWLDYVQRPGASSPVVDDPPGVFDWQWVNVGNWNWPSGDSFRIYAVHASVLGRTGVCPVSFKGIRFIRWIPTVPNYIASIVSSADAVKWSQHRSLETAASGGGLQCP